MNEVSKTLLEQLKADLELAEKATPGPWEFRDTTQMSKLMGNACFIAASRTRWPATTRALIVALEALQNHASADQVLSQIKELLEEK